MERVSRALALVGPAMLLVAVMTTAMGAIVGGLVCGWLSVVRPVESGAILPGIRVLLFVVTILVALAPMFVGVRGGGSRFSRLLILPIPRRTLHFVEVVSSLVDPWMAYVLPGLLSFAAGLVLSAAMRSEIWQRDFMIVGGMAAFAAVAFTFTLVSLSSLVSFLVGWIVRDRRRSEMFVLVFVLAISGASIVPLMMRDVREGRQGAGLQEPSARIRRPIASDLMDLPSWVAWAPSELYGSVVETSGSGRRATAWRSLAALLGEGALLYWLSFLVHDRLIDSVAVGRAHRKGRLRRGGIRRMPGFWPGTSAVALAQAYTALRTVRGRLVVLLPGPLIAMFAFLFRRLSGASNFEQLIATHGYVAFGIGMIFGLYAASAITMNQYGSDRSGLTLQFLQPIRDVDVVRGKTAGCAMIFGAGALLTLACTLLVAPSGSPWLWLATLLGGAATFLAISPIAAWMSVWFPVASDLSKTGAGGNPHALAMLVGMLVTAVAVVPAALIIALTPPRLAPLWMGVWTAMTAAVAFPLLRLVALTIRARRENLVLVAQRR